MKGHIAFTFRNGRFATVGDTIGAQQVSVWLGSDIQYNIEGVAHVMDGLAAAESGADPDYSGFGNSTWIAASRTHVYLESQGWKLSCVLMTHSQARDALMRYRTFLDHGWSNESRPPAPFEIEYLAEGEEARRIALEMGLAENWINEDERA